MHSYTKEEGTYLQKLRKMNQKLSVKREKTKIKVKDDNRTLYFTIFYVLPFWGLKAPANVLTETAKVWSFS